MKYVLQIVAAFFYTCLFTGIIYLVMVVPVAFIISLPWWAMLIVLLLGGGIIEGFISLFQLLGILPYAWIVKGNSVAMWLSILLMYFNLGHSTFALWQSLYGGGFWAVVIAIVFTGMVLQLAFMTTASIIGLRDKE